MKKKGKVLPSDNNSPNRTDYPRETEPGEKKEKVLPSDNNSPNRTDYPRETEPGEKKEKVLPSDNNSPNRTDYPRGTEPGDKKGKVLPSDNNSPNRTDYPRGTEPGEKKGKVLPSDNNSPNSVGNPSIATLVTHVVFFSYLYSSRYTLRIASILAYIFFQKTTILKTTLGFALRGYTADVTFPTPSPHLSRRANVCRGMNLIA